MALIGDLIEDDPGDRIADLAVHAARLRAERDALADRVDALLRDRDRYRTRYYRERSPRCSRT